MTRRFVFCLLISLCITAPQTNNATDAAQQAATQQSLKTLDGLTRYGGLNDFEIEYLDSDNEDDLQTYLIGIASLSAYGLVPAIILLLFIFPWFVCRCCCKKCCKCCQGNPRQNWSKRQRYLPLLMIIIITLVFVVVSSLGYIANNDFSDAIISDEEAQGLYHIVTTDVVGGLSEFCGNVSAQLYVIYSAAEPSGDIETYVTNLKTYQDEINTGNNDIVSEIDTYASTWENFEISSTYLITETLYLTNQSDYFNQEITLIGTEVWNVLNNTLIQLTDTLLETREDIYDSVSDIYENLVIPAKNSTDDMYDLLLDAEPTVEDIESNRALAFNIIFCLPFVPIIIFIFAMICRKSIKLMTIAYSCAWLVAILLFMILATHLPIAGGIMDFCQFLDKSEDGFETAFQNQSMADMGKVLDACLSNTELVTTFGLENQLNFTGVVEFPDFPNVAPYFKFNLWGNHTELISGGEYDDGTFFTPNMTYCEISPDADCTTGSTEWNNINSDIDDIDDTIETVKDTAVIVIDEFAAAEDLLTPLFDSGDNIVDLMRCGFIGDAYWDFKETTCEDILSSLALICACIAVNASLCVLLAIVIIRTRKHYKNYTKIDSENEFSPLNSPNKDDSASQNLSVELVRPSQQSFIPNGWTCKHCGYKSELHPAHPPDFCNNCGKPADDNCNDNQSIII